MAEKMRDYYLGLPGGLTACFRSACDIRGDEAVRLGLGAYVPGISFLDEKPRKPDIKLENPQASFSDDFYHLLYGMTRAALLRRGYYCVHAACVGNDNGYMLIPGHSGAGKTTLAQRLVDRHGLKLLSGNKTVVRFAADGTIRAIAGTRTMTALDGAGKRYAYAFAPGKYAPEGGEGIVSSIALIRVNGGVREFAQLPRLSAAHTLYPFFMDAVNADVIVGGGRVFDAAPPLEAKEKLAAGLLRMQAPVYKISGPMPYLERKALKP
jgi:hypothetical protein